MVLTKFKQKERDEMTDAGIVDGPTSNKATGRLIRLIRKLPKEKILSLLYDLEESYHENKREVRIPYCAEVIFSVNGKFYTGYIANINSNGIFIETENIFSIGERLTLSFEPPNNGKHLKNTGKIIRISKNGIGIIFDADIEDHMKIPQIHNATYAMSGGTNSYIGSDQAECNKNNMIS